MGVATELTLVCLVNVVLSNPVTREGEGGEDTPAH